MILFHKTYLTLSLIALFVFHGSFALCAPFLTVSAVLSCPLKNVISHCISSSDTPVEELTVCITGLIDIILQGNREALAECIEKSSISILQPLQDSQIFALQK